MKTTLSQDIDALVLEAQQSPRLRAHLLLHKHSDPVLKLVMAMEPGSYIQPHRHPNYQELFVILRGKLTVVTFDESGSVDGKVTISSQGEAITAEVALNQWHTMWPTDGGCVSLEVTKGPYDEKTFKEFAPWAPSEAELAHLEYSTYLLNL